VRTADGVFCSTKHRDSARLLRRAAAEPLPPVDISEEISTALAIRTEQRDQIIKFIAPPIGATAESWFMGKSPDTVVSYRSSARHLVKWAQGKRYIVGGGDEIDGLRRIFLSYGQADVTALLEEWVREQKEEVQRTARKRKPRSAAGIKTRCAGVFGICKMLFKARQILYLPVFDRPRVRAENPLDRVRRYSHVEPAYDTFMAKIDELALKRSADPIDVRDRTIVRLSGQMGLRRIEIVRLDVEHVDAVAALLTIHGKARDGTETRRISPSTMAALNRWIDVRSNLVGDTGPLFYGSAERLGPTPARMQRHSLNRMMHRHAKKFGIELGPHDLRRVFCTEANARYSPAEAMALTRHKSMDTLKLYDLREGEAMVANADEVGDAIARRGKNLISTPEQAGDE